LRIHEPIIAKEAGHLSSAPAKITPPLAATRGARRAIRSFAFAIAIDALSAVFANDAEMHHALAIADGAWDRLVRRTSSFAAEFLVGGPVCGENVRPGICQGDLQPHQPLSLLHCQLGIFLLFLFQPRQLDDLLTVLGFDDCAFLGTLLLRRRGWSVGIQGACLHRMTPADGRVPPQPYGEQRPANDGENAAAVHFIASKRPVLVYPLPLTLPAHQLRCCRS
jgi:hypothetical protein